MGEEVTLIEMECPDGCGPLKPFGKKPKTDGATIRRWILACPKCWNGVEFPVPRMSDAELRHFGDSNDDQGRARGPDGS